jgi:hypothetical protein
MSRTQQTRGGRGCRPTAGSRPNSRFVARRILRALNSPGSGMSDARWPVYWLRGSSLHARPSQDHSQWLWPTLTTLRVRFPLQLQGQPSFRPLRPSLRSRTPARICESQQRLTSEVSTVSPRPSTHTLDRTADIPVERCWVARLTGHWRTIDSDSGRDSSMTPAVSNVTLRRC